MSEPTPSAANVTMPTVRLLEPRALVSADRLTRRLEDRAWPLLRGMAAGASRFSERIFDSWIGASLERRESASAARSPRGLEFPRPWYEKPPVSWPARGITLRAPEPLAGVAAVEPRAFELIAAYAPESAMVEPVVDLAPTSSSVALAPAPASPGGFASRGIPRVERPTRTLAAPTPSETAAPVFVAADAPRRLARPEPAGVAARLIERLSTVDSMLRVVLGGASTPPSVDEPRPSTASGRVEHAPQRVFIERVDPAAAEPRRASTSSSVALSPALPPSAAWPRLQRFLVELAGPTTLTQAGTLVPPAFPPAAQVVAERARAPFARELVTPLAPETLSARHAPASEAAARPAPFSTAERTPSAATVPGLVVGQRPPAPATATAPSLASLPSFVTASMSQAPSVRQATSLSAPEFAFAGATLLGELAWAEAVSEGTPVPAAWRPGRTAQRAELLATVAERRVARQLGLPAPSSAALGGRWSADAFTLIAPAYESGLVADSRPRATTPGAAIPPRAASVGVATTLGAQSLVAPGSHGPGGSLARPTPGSVAALLAFADAQLGPRLLGQASPLPVRGPEPVYLRPVADAPTARPVVGSLPTARPVVGSLPTARPLGPIARRDEPGPGPHVTAPLSGTLSVALGAPPLMADSTVTPWAMRSPSTEVAYAEHVPAAGGSSLPWVEPTSLGQVGRRSEQLAGELGVRAASLASEFLIDAPASEESDSAPAPAARVRPGWMSTSDWVLLSLFPSQATATQVAQSVQQRALTASSIIASLPRSQSSPSSPSAQLTATSMGASMRTLVEMSASSTRTPSPSASSLSGLSPSGLSLSGQSPGTSSPSQAATPTLAARAAMAPARVVLAGGVAGQPVGEAGGAARSALLATLPDGRMPRGSRIVARAPMPVVGLGEAPGGVVAQVAEAAGRRLEQPDSAPLWSLLRPQAAPAAEAPPVEVGTPRAAALELVAPFVESAKPEGSAAAFAREAMPVVAPRRSTDDATKSLVTALNAASSQSASDRLSLADLTLISIASAAEQVAASPQGASPAPASRSARPPSAAGGAGGGGVDADEAMAIDTLAREVFRELKQLLADEHEADGGSSEGF